MSKEDIYKPFVDFDKDIKERIMRSLSKSEKNKISKEINEEIFQWNNSLSKKAKQQGGLTRKIKNTKKYSKKEINSFIEKRETIKKEKESIRTLKENLSSKIKDVLGKNDKVKIQGYKTIEVSKEKILTSQNPGLFIIRQQINAMKKDMKGMEEISTGMKIQYEKYLANLSMYKNEKDFQEVVEEDKETYEDLLEWMEENKETEYPLEWYATPSNIILQ